jgi:thymidylate synthase
MDDGFPLITTKKMAFKSIVTELLWFLRGDTNIKFLLNYNCHIWNGDAYKNYVSKTSLEYNGQYTPEEFINKIKNDDDFAKKWGDLGPIYGMQWRSWKGVSSDMVTSNDMECGSIGMEYRKHGIDQITHLISELKTNPDSRRLMVNAWNVAELDEMILPPCHYGFQVYTRELSLDERIRIYELNRKNSDDTSTTDTITDFFDKLNIPSRAISLIFNMRSTDVGLGLPFNLASYGLLLMMIAKQVNMIPDELIYSGGDVHIYLNQIDIIKEQLSRRPYKLPNVYISDVVVDDISEYGLHDIVLHNYQYHSKLSLPLSN